MAIIYSYPEKTTPAGGDFLVITDSEQPAPNKNRTKSLTIDNLASYVISSQGAITGSGTPGFIPIFTTATTLGNSAIAQLAISKGINDVYITEDVDMGPNELSVGSIRLSGALYAPTQFIPFWSSGTAGQLLSSTGTGVEWTSGGPVVGSGTPDDLTAWNAAGTGIKDSIVSQTVTQAVTPIGILNINGSMQQSYTLESIYIGKNVGSSVNTYSAFQMLHNIGIGDEVLKNFETGNDGGGALEVPGDNVGIGYKALESTRFGTNNIAIGTSALNLVNLGGNNIAIGKNSLAKLGYTTLGPQDRAVTLGNTAMGFNALTSLETGTFNIAIGQSSLEAATGTDYTIAIGRNVAKAFTGDMDRAIMIGDEVLDQAGTTGTLVGVNDSIFIGRRAAAFIRGTAVGDIGIGKDAFFGQNGSFNSGGYNIAIGYTAQSSNGANTERSICIGSSGQARSYATNVSTVDTTQYNGNDAMARHSALIGGYANTAQGEASFIGAGHNNTIGPDAVGAAILGGFDNTISPSSAQGTAGMALGSNLDVAGNNQVVVGRYNIATNDSKLIVGAGFSNANRINVLDVKNSGQLRLGKYGQTPSNFPAGDIFTNNINVLGATSSGDIKEISPSVFDEQILSATEYNVSTGFTVNLGANVGRLVRVTWSGQTGTATLTLPDVAQFSNKYVQVVTDNSFQPGGPAPTILNITTPFGSGQTINGQVSYSIVAAYKSATFWSDGIEYFVIAAV